MLQDIMYYNLTSTYPLLLFEKISQRITEAEREVLRKNVKNMIPQFKKSEIVNHFKRKGIKKEPFTRQ